MIGLKGSQHNKIDNYLANDIYPLPKKPHYQLKDVQKILSEMRSSMIDFYERLQQRKNEDQQIITDMRQAIQEWSGQIREILFLYKSSKKELNLFFQGTTSHVFESKDNLKFSRLGNKKQKEYALKPQSMAININQNDISIESEFSQSQTQHNDVLSKQNCNKIAKLQQLRSEQPRPNIAESQNLFHLKGIRGRNFNLSTSNHPKIQKQNDQFCMKTTVTTQVSEFYHKNSVIQAISEQVQDVPSIYQVIQIPTEIMLRKPMMDEKNSFCQKCHNLEEKLKEKQNIRNRIYELNVEYKVLGDCNIFSKVFQQNFKPDKKSVSYLNKCKKVIYEIPIELQMENSNFNIDIMEQKMPEIGGDFEDDDELKMTNMIKKDQFDDEIRVSYTYNLEQSQDISHNYAVPCQSLNIHNYQPVAKLPNLQMNNADRKKNIYLSSSQIQSVELGCGLGNKNKFSPPGLMYQHPELNFCQSSSLTQSNYNPNYKASQFYTNAPPDPHQKSSIKQFKQSVIQSNPNKKQRIIDSNASFIQPFKAENPIIIMDQSSSEESETLRQMQLSEKVEFKNQIKEKMVDLADFYELKEKIISLQEERYDLMQQIRSAKQQIDELKQVKQTNEMTIEGYKLRVNQIKEKLCIYDKNMQILQQDLNKKNMENQSLSQSFGELEELKNAQIKEKEEVISKLAEQLIRVSKQYEQDVQENRLKLEQKENLISELTKEFEIGKKMLTEQINQLRAINEQQKKNMAKIQSEIDQKMAQIEQIQKQKSQLAISLEIVYKEKNGLEEINNLMHSDQIKREQGLLEKQKYEQALDCLKNQNKFLRESFEIATMGLEKEQGLVKGYQRQLKECRKQMQNLKKEKQQLRIKLQGYISEQLEYIKGQMVQLKKELTNKDKIIRQLRSKNSRILVKSGHQQYKGRLSVEFIEEKEEDYSRQLEKMLRKYEQIIKNDQQTIEDLQKRVYEYLGDALEKEKQSEILHQSVCNYENDLNNLLIQKIQLETENQRMKKIISSSEKRFSTLGSRLINACKEQNVEDLFISPKNKIEKTTSSTVQIRRIGSDIV